MSIMRTVSGLPLPTVDSCYFCDILEGRTEGWNLLERTEQTATLVNGRQFEVGQCIVIPVRHAPTLFDLSDAEASAVVIAARWIADALLREFEPDGILLYQNNGLGSGQEVPHFHLHVVPRRSESNWGAGPPQVAGLGTGDTAAYADHTAVTEEKRGVVSRLRRQLTR